jgi:hypothetical protein
MNELSSIFPSLSRDVSVEPNAWARICLVVDALQRRMLGKTVMMPDIVSLGGVAACYCGGVVE